MLRMLPMMMMVSCHQSELLSYSASRYKDLPAPVLTQFTLGSARVNISPLQAKPTLKNYSKCGW